MKDPRRARGENCMVEKIGTLHLFLNKIELWDCRSFPLSAFEMKIRERLELSPDVGTWGSLRGVRGGKRGGKWNPEPQAEPKAPRICSPWATSPAYRLLKGADSMKGWAKCTFQMWLDSLCSPHPDTAHQGKSWCQQEAMGNTEDTSFQLLFSLSPYSVFLATTWEEWFCYFLFLSNLKKENILHFPKFDKLWANILVEEDKDSPQMWVSWDLSSFGVWTFRTCCQKGPESCFEIRMRAHGQSLPPICGLGGWES